MQPAMLIALILTTLCFAQNSVIPLAGTHSGFGPYQGSLELREREDGQVDVVRLIA